MGQCRLYAVAILAGRWYGPTWGKDQIADSMKMVATSRKFHPVRSWLDAQQVWDGVSRLDRWTSLYMGAEENPYTILVGRLWLISRSRANLPARVQGRPCADLGRTTRFKSQQLRLLANHRGSGMVQRHEHAPRHQDSYVSLRGVGSLSSREFQQLIRAETEDAKAFFTSCVDRYRPPL